jgi:signal transduction histidine kinase
LAIVGQRTCPFVPEVDMSKIDEYLLYSVVTILFVNLIAAVAVNLDNLNAVLILSVIIVGVLIYNELFVMNEKGKLLSFWACSLTALSLCIYISLQDNGNSMRVFYFIIMYQIYRKMSKKIAVTSFVIILGIQLSSNLYKANSTGEIIKAVTLEMVLALLVLTIVALISYVINQNKALESMQQELAVKNFELECTHNDLLQAYNKLEEYTIIKERGIIARDMHDTVGHTLTTALVELEVSNLLLEKDAAKAKEKLIGATAQVRKGLYNLRTSVRVLKETIDYLSEIKELIANAEKHAGVTLKVFMDELKDLDNNILACIYRILQEGLTNGIKHGKATAFLLRINIENVDGSKYIKLYLTDNGQGTTAFKRGFGTNAMEERVKELNGKIEFEYQRDAGFGICAEIPAAQDKRMVL